MGSYHAPCIKFLGSEKFHVFEQICSYSHLPKVSQINCSYATFQIHKNSRFTMTHHHHHHPSAAEQVITRFLHAHRSLASVAISSADISSSYHDILTTVGCMWCKRCVDVPASFCHEVVHKKRIFLQALPLEDEGCVQGTLAGAFWHNAQEAQCWSWNK